MAVDYSLYELLRKCTVFLSTSRSNSTGFFVAPRLILTCAHVLKGINQETDEITIRLVNDQKYTATLHQQESEIDLALLELKDCLAHPCVYLDEAVKVFDRLYTYGYSDYGPNGSPVTVSCEGMTGDRPSLIKFKEGQIRPGMSGSPLLNVRTGKVCGVIKLSFDRNANLGGEAITTTTILQKFPKLETLQQNWHQTNRIWIDFLNTETERDRLHDLPNHNLPRQITKFIGRDKEVKELINYISFESPSHIIIVGGVGGAGKTALVIEAAYKFLETNDELSSKLSLFDAIIFTSAKTKKLSSSRLESHSSVQSTLFDILRVIAKTLNFDLTTNYLKHSSSDNEEIIKERVREKLRQQNTLLIIDNFETINEAEQEKVLGFLRNLTDKTKAVVTTRKQINIYTDITLECLSESESSQLTQLQLEQLLKAKNISLDEEQIIQIGQRIYQRRGGLPLALIWDTARLVTQLGDNDYLTLNSDTGKLVINDRNHLEQILNEVLGSFHKQSMRPICSDQVGEFCLKEVIQQLRGNPAHKLLMSLAIFKASAVKDAIVKVAGVNDGKELKRLQELFLININSPTNAIDIRYWMLPFTQDYILNEELNLYADFCSAAHERWIKWYKDLASKYGGKDWEEWYVKYDYLKQEWDNFLEVLDWCASQNRLSDVNELWNDLNDYASLYGCWTERLYWTSWLSEKQCNWLNDAGIYALSSKSFTLIQMGQINEAEKLLSRAWNLAKNQPPYVRDSLAKHWSYLYIRLGKYDKAREWLNQQRNVIDQLIKDRDLILRQLVINHQRIEKTTEQVKTLILQQIRITRSLINIKYYEGEICFQENQYEQARKIFEKVVDEATQVKWTRRVNYAKHWLADLQIVEAETLIDQNDLIKTKQLLSKARTLLTECYLVAELNHDKRRMANYQFSRAKLEKLWSDLERKQTTLEQAQVHWQEAINWANLAIDNCKRLGMEADRERIETWLLSI